MHKLFAYGTLQLPEVMRRVAGRDFPAEPARLPGYARRRLRDRSFPGIRPVVGESVAGLVYGGVQAPAWRRLDAFEDDFYRRETVRLILDGGGECWAQAYVVREESAGLLLPEEWSLAEFAQTRLRDFLLRHE